MSVLLWIVGTRVLIYFIALVGVFGLAVKAQVLGRVVLLLFGF